MGLLEQLSIDPEAMSWEDWASCRGFVGTPLAEGSEETSHPFFEGYEADHSQAKAIDQLCFSCPVQQACGSYGHQNRLEGVWGGVYLDSRGSVDRKRNEHKNDSDWKRIKEIFSWV